MRDWRQAIVAIGAAADGQRVDTSRVAGASLRALVWDPVVPHLGKARRVFIVPDSTFSLVPFAALPVGRQSYLLEAGPVIHYLSAERDLLPSSDTVRRREACLRWAVRRSTIERVVARAPISVPWEPHRHREGRARRNPCGALENVTFPPLQGDAAGSQRALDCVEQRECLRGRGRACQHSDRPCRGRNDLQARGAPIPSVLHIATHGVLPRRGVHRSRIPGARGVGRLSRASPSTAQPPENPLLLSGLAFAGANRRLSAPIDQDDGILTAEEVASLDLQGVEWAVLSAWDTGLRGDFKAGEGVLGLRRAFQMAGARTVIMSLVVG